MYETNTQNWKGFIQSLKTAKEYTHERTLYRN